MYRITKVFKGYPFAHRQHTHDGHCRLIHGHNWDFEITLEADELDENGFVYDFGKFDWLKKWLEFNFDHTCLINKNDPKRDFLINELERKLLAKIIVVDSCSSEGIAKMVYKNLEERLLNDALPEYTRGVRLVSVTVHEDYKNSATYTGE